MALTVQRAVNDRLFTDQADDGDVLTWPLPLLSNLIANDQEPLNPLFDDIAGLDVGIGEDFLAHIGRQVRHTDNAPVIQRDQLIFLLRAPIILGHADMVLTQPVAEVR